MKYISDLKDERVLPLIAKAIAIILLFILHFLSNSARCGLLSPMFRLREKVVAQSSFSKFLLSKSNQSTNTFHIFIISKKSYLCVAFLENFRAGVQAAGAHYWGNGRLGRSGQADNSRDRPI